MSTSKKTRKLLARANAAASRGDNEEAERCYREFVTEFPEHSIALFNLGFLAYSKMKKEREWHALHKLASEAMDFFSRSILSPDVDMQTKADAMNSNGLILQQLGYPDKAKISFHLALQMFPGHKAARINFAGVLAQDGEYDAADREFFEIINSDPNSAGALFSRSMIRLLMGDIKNGFMEYRSRYNVPAFVSKMMDTDKPLWNGEDLNGKTLVIHQEQGYGDAIQFIRYAELIKDRWPECTIIYHGYDCLKTLFKGAKGVDRCVDSEAKEKQPFPHDCHAPLMHLPDIMGTTLETIPANCPYIVPREDWLPVIVKSTAGYDRDGIEHEAARIGIVWAGSPIHGRDKVRSIDVEQFQRFIDAAPQAQFYSLQCGPRQPEVANLKNCIDLAPQISDWSHTANAILQMDLIVSVDTAVCHLAGALGKPCWILLASSPDWRWMLSRPTSPWYPLARLFRQPVKDDWESVIVEVIQELKNI